jgi:hypothetical protein
MVAMYSSRLAMTSYSDHKVVSMDKWRWRWRETYSDKFLQLFVTKIVDVSSAIFAQDSGHH